MHTLLVIVHVLLVVLVVGPAMLLPWLGEQALRHRDGDAIHAVGRRTMAFNALTLVVALFGTLSVLTDDEVAFSDPWIIISSTLYVVALVIGAGLIPLALAKTGKDLQDSGGIMDGEKLEQHRGKILALTGLNILFYSAIVILMVWQP